MPMSRPATINQKGVSLEEVPFPLDEDLGNAAIAVAKALPKDPDGFRKYRELSKEIAWKSPALKAEEVYEKILLKRSEGVREVFTGLDWWDGFAGPFRRGNTYVICGYAGVGKTTLAIQLAWNMALAGRRVWFYCLELSAAEVFEVLAGHISGCAVPSPEQECAAYAMIQTTGFRFYEPNSYKTWEKRLDEITTTTRKEELDVVFIDNLGYLTRTLRGSFEVEGVVSARIKSLSQELEIPIVTLHHLRKPDGDGVEFEPNGHAIKGSSAIIQDASDAFILHHPLNDFDAGYQQTRNQVGYLLSTKPRWGGGGVQFVRLEGAKRLYSTASREEYPKRKMKRGF